MCPSRLRNRQLGSPAIVRAASQPDAPRIAEIYNQAIDDRNATFDEFHVEASRFDEFFCGDARRSLVVADARNEVVGWASVSPISERWAYRFTALASFYVHRDFRGNGFGHVLKAAQIVEAKRLGYHSLIGEALATNLVSLWVNLSHGFKVVGEIREAGYRDGQWVGLIVLQRSLEDVDSPQLQAGSALGRLQRPPPPAGEPRPNPTE